MKSNFDFGKVKTIFTEGLKSYIAISLPVLLLVALFTLGSLLYAAGTGVQDNERHIGDVRTSEFQIVVTRENFNEFFTLTGRVNVGPGTWTPTFVADTGIVTLTEQTAERAGFASLNRKISPEQDFFFKGAVNLGANSKGGTGTTASGPATGTVQGGDGIGFFFHSYEPGTIGRAGSGMGIGGLSNAFGFKLDTFSNRTIHNANLSRTDRMFPDNTSFASFIHTAWFTNAPVSDYFTHNHPQFDGTGATATAQTNSAQASLAAWIGALPPERENEAPRTIFHPNDNNFRDIEVFYGGPSKVMTIDYDDRGFHLASSNPIYHENWRVWEKNISDWIVEDYLSFGFSAATGAAVNLQQIRFDEFRFTPMSNITIRYVDELTGNPIIPDINHTRPAGTQLQLDARIAEMSALGYDFVRVVSTEPSRFDANTNTVVLSVEENRTVTFYFRQADRPVVLNFETEAGLPVYFRQEEVVVARQDESFIAALASTFTPEPNLLVIPGHELVAWYVVGQHDTPILVSVDPNPRIQNVQDDNRLVLIYREKMRDLCIRKIVEDDTSHPDSFNKNFTFNITVFNIHNQPRTEAKIPFTHSDGSTGIISLNAQGVAQGAFTLQHSEYITLQVGYFSSVEVLQTTEGDFITRIEDAEENLLATARVITHYMAGTDYCLVFISEIHHMIIATGLNLKAGKEVVLSFAVATLATVIVVGSKTLKRKCDKRPLPMQ